MKKEREECLGAGFRGTMDERFEASHSESPAERRVVQLYTCAFVCNGVNGQDVNPYVSHRLS